MRSLLPLPAGCVRLDLRSCVAGLGGVHGLSEDAIQMWVSSVRGQGMCMLILTFWLGIFIRA